MNRREHLQLMVYDETDVKTRLLRLKSLDVLPDDVDKVDIDVPLGLSHSWFAGGRLYRRFGAIDTFQGFRVWYRALEWMATIHPEQKIDHIQFWGHGSPGRVWMDGEALSRDAFTGPHGDVLRAIRERLTDDALIWFRTCSTFGAARGHEFARVWADNMGCRVAAHTHVINFFHGGLHTLRPGEKPAWPLVEGLEKGTVDRPQKMKKSGWWWQQPHTVTCLNNDFPKNW